MADPIGVDVPELPPELIGPANLEKYKAQLAVWAEQNKSDIAHQSKAAWHQADFANGPGFAAVLQFTLSGLRSLMLLNGGAVIALLTLVGNEVSHSNHAGAFAASLQMPFILFITGLFAGLVTTLLSYVSQVFFTELGHEASARKLGNAIRYGAFGIACGGGVCFAVGSGLAIHALTLL